jgi:2-amino-4-hydroxy-6-hydroxymethyldihydropteridine diphosphokinase
MMNFDKWYPIYKEIINDFSFSEEEDYNAASMLDYLLESKSYHVTQHELSTIIKNKAIVIFGAGPSLEHCLDTYQTIIQNNVLISADGATSALLKRNIIPDIIVTDLDGAVDDQILANQKGSIMLVHAHGDNIKNIKTYLPKISKKLCGSIQTDPSSFSHVYNFGGFTDGDRSVFLAAHFEAKEIYLMGFDFLGPVGSYSLPSQKNTKIKLKKLLRAKKLIDLLSYDLHIQILH